MHRAAMVACYVVQQEAWAYALQHYLYRMDGWRLRRRKWVGNNGLLGVHCNQKPQRQLESVAEGKRIPPYGAVCV